MVKPIGPLCNLHCQYCFYLEKTQLFPAQERYRMTTQTLEQFTRAYIESNPAPELVFAWQGGEPTLMGLDFFKKAVALQKQYGDGRPTQNALQTNGTLLDDEWCRFFHDEGFLVGLSVDGPRKLHDEFRVDKKGEGSHENVVRGAETLNRHKVEWNALTCVNKVNSRKPLDVYRFLRGLGAKFIQFIPIVERRPDASAKALGLSLCSAPNLTESNGHPAMMPWSVPAADYGSFLISIFERWVRHDVGRVHVQIFDVALGKWLGVGGGLCVFDETCGRALAMEHNGDLYACDHYVYPTHHRGNVASEPLAGIVDSAAQEDFGKAKSDALPRQCRNCPVAFACMGGCPKQRFIHSRDGEPGLNYLCQGYRDFFTHVDPYMRTMADLYQRGRPPAEIMQMLSKQGRTTRN